MGTNNDYNERQRQQARERALLARNLRNIGTTWKAIGKHFGFSAQRAQALVSSHFKGKK